MGSKKKGKSAGDGLVYDPKAMDYLIKMIYQITAAGEYTAQTIPENPQLDLSMRIDPHALETAIRDVLPKKQREVIEKFFGLKGSQNYCQMLMRLRGRITDINPGLINMRKDAEQALQKLLRLDEVAKFDRNFTRKVQFLAGKIDKTGTGMTDLECVKYVILYAVFMQNGPKYSNEEVMTLISVENERDTYWSGYVLMNELCEKFAKHGEGTISMKMILSFIGMMDLEHVDIMMKTCGLVPWEIEKYPDQEIPVLDTLSLIRELKQKMFTSGSWNATWKIISGEKIDLNSFWDSPLRNNFSMLFNYKTGTRKIRIVEGKKNIVKEIPVYNVGGIEFTDEMEIMFFYLESTTIMKLMKS